MSNFKCLWQSMQFLQISIGKYYIGFTPLSWKATNEHFDLMDVFVTR